MFQSLPNDILWSNKVHSFDDDCFSKFSCHFPEFYNKTTPHFRAQVSSVNHKILVVFYTVLDVFVKVLCKFLEYAN